MLRLLAGLLLAAPVAAQGPFVLTDTRKNVHLDDFTLEPRNLGMEGAWSVTRRTLRGGRQEGVDSILLDTGRIQAEVLPTRGMSILRLVVDGRRLGWDSPSREVVHPSQIDLERREGLGWLDGFNEWMVRCGLAWAGHPGTDSWTDAGGGKHEELLTLHGRIGNVPARQVVLEVEPGDPVKLHLRGIVEESSFGGPRLRLETELVLAVGASGWELRDRVTNLGAREQEFQLIYHGNYGVPFLGEGSEAVVAAASITPMTPKAAAGLETWSTYGPPTPGFEEEVFLIEPLANGAGLTEALLMSPKRNLATTVQWSVEELPYFTLWKNTAAFEDGYVTGLEPGTSFPFNRSIERAAGRVPTLAPGESRSFTLRYSVHMGQAARLAAQRIRALQATAEPVVLPVPETD